MSLAGKTVVILTANDFEESEFIYPYYRMKEEGADVVVSGLAGEDCTGKHGLSLKMDKLLAKLDFDSVHTVIVPGGYAPDTLRMNERVQALVHHVHTRGGIVAAICHGPWVLVSADLIKGTACTSFHSIKDDLINAGGLWENSPVVVSNRIITSRSPEDLPAFCKAIISYTSKLNF